MIKARFGRGRSGNSVPLRRGSRLYGASRVTPLRRILYTRHCVAARNVASGQGDYGSWR